MSLELPTMADASPLAWSKGARSHGARELFQYPAMMVSPMQQALLARVIAERGSGEPNVVFDPFAGSGTTLGESMAAGCRWVGVDINPLAVLMCQIRLQPPSAEAAAAALHRVSRAAARDDIGCTRQGAWLSKWYRADAAASLDAVSRAIRDVKDLPVRRLLWVSLAECARTTGNMRLSTPKLQTRVDRELARPIDVVRTFDRVAEGNIAELARQTTDLRSAGRFVNGAYAEPATVLRSDVRQMRWPSAMPPADIVLTSPPYGDNHTTMPYGQHSYLPLRWVDTDDIDPFLDPALIGRSKTLDTASLGGSRVLDAELVDRATSASASLGETLLALRGYRDGATRVASFFSDFAVSLDRVSRFCADDAHWVLTLGDRTVGGVRIPTAAICAELLSYKGVELVDGYHRRIGRNKRLPTRNGYSPTIALETVLIMRRSA